MTGATNHRRSAAVFDFDKTLFNIDVAYHFLDTAIKRSRTRRLAAGMIMPLLLPMLLTRRSRIIAVSTLMWIATFPLRGRTARDVFSAFASKLFSPPLNGRFYNEGLRTLAAHRRLDHQRLILSGSPQELVRLVAQSVLKRDIVVIGSQVGPFLGGLIYRRYCMGSEKIKLAKEQGMIHGHWDYGYSDSALDIPLLAHCRHRSLVNPDKKTIKRVKTAFGDRVTVLNWTDTKKKNPQQ